MRYFFVTTYAQICYRVLPLIEKFNPDEVTIVTYSPISDFFIHYTNFKVIVLESDLVLLSRNPFKLLKNLWINTKEFDENLSGLNNNEIYFFGRSWKLGVYRHIKRLSYFNKIIYQPSDTCASNQIQKTDIKSKFISLFVSLLIGIPVQVVKDTGVVSFDLKDKFFDKYVEEISLIKDFVPTRKFDVELPVMKNKDVLVVTERFSHYVNNSEVLVSVLDCLDNARTVMKTHPIDSYYESLSFNYIPKEIPSELLMSHPWKYIIGVESHSLIRASQLTDATVISLLNLFDYKNEERKQELIKWHIEGSNGKIIFPKTIDEFKELIQ